MKSFHRLAAVTALVLSSFGAQAAPVVVDVSGAQSVNLIAEAGNTVWLINVGANAVLNSLDWTVTLNAFSPSRLSEMEVSFGNSSGVDMVTFAPGALDDVSGSGSYTGTADLAPLGLSAGADGLLRIEFSEYTKDFGLNVAEGQWVSGNLTFDVSAVPEPSSVLLLALGLAAICGQARRSRRR